MCVLLAASLYPFVSFSRRRLKKKKAGRKERKRIGRNLRREIKKKTLMVVLGLVNFGLF